MGFLKRFSNSLFAPKDVANFRNDRWWMTLLYFLILVLLLVIPHTIVTVQSDILDYEAKKEIRNHFNGDDDIPFAIINGILVHDSNDSAFVYQNELFNSFIIVITTGNEVSDNNVIDTNIKLVFKTDGVYLEQMLLSRKLFLYDEYPILNGIDFSDATSYNNIEFWENIFYVANEEISKIRPIFNFIDIIIFALSTIIDLLLVCLIISIFQMFTLSNFIKFSKLFKLCIYLLTPYTLGNLLRILFSINFFYYLGFLVSIIYVTILSRTIIKQAMKRG